MDENLPFYCKFIVSDDNICEMENKLAEGDYLTINFNSFPDTIIDNKRLKPTFENFWAIIWFKKGKGRYFIDFKEYRFRENTIIIISKNQDVSFEFVDVSSQYTTITFAQDYVKSVHEEVRKLLSFCIREHIEGKQILELNEEAEHYLQNIVDNLSSINKHWTGKLKKDSSFHFLQLFLLYCTELVEKQQVNYLEGYTETVGRFTTLLESNFKKTQRVNFYTDSLNLTYNSLSRYTTEYCKKTPKEIITERLILETMRLLSATDKPVKQIAYDLGFDEPTNFVKFFKKYTSLTPSQFRKQQ